MSLDDPRHAGAPTPLRGMQQPADPTAPVENPATASARAPERVVPAGFSRGEDAIYQQQWGPQQPWQPAPQQQAPGSQSWQQPPAAPSRARVPATLPLDGQVYAQVLRPLPRRVGRWFLAWAIAIGFFALGQGIALALMMPAVIELFADPSAVPTDPAELMDRLIGTPMAFLGVNLSWAAMIPGAIVALAAYGDKAMGFAFSVAGRWRWKAVGWSALVVLPIFAVYVGSTFLLDSSIEWRFQPDWLLVAIVVLTTPLQSAGEEFTFRGIVTQQVGSWMRNPWAASLVTGGAIGVVFGLAHANYPPLAMLQVALVGFTCAILTFRTGGLEAACVLHAANNVFIMLPLALMGVSPFSTSTGAEGPFWTQLVSFAACLAALGLSYAAVHLVSRRWQRRTEGAPGAEALLLPKQQPVLAATGWPAAPAGAWPQQGGWAPPQGRQPQPVQQPWQGGGQQGWQPGQQQWAPQQDAWAQPQQAPQQWPGQQQWQPPASAPPPQQHPDAR